MAVEFHEQKIAGVDFAHNGVVALEAPSDPEGGVGETGCVEGLTRFDCCFVVLHVGLGAVEYVSVTEPAEYESCFEEVTNYSHCHP
jgi:hypothetical protein